MSNFIGCICLTFLHCAFSNVQSSLRDSKSSTTVPASNFTPHFGNHNRREAAGDKIYHMIPSLFSFYCLPSACGRYISISVFVFLYASVPRIICRSYCDRKIAKPCLSGFRAKIALQSFSTFSTRSAGREGWNICQQKWHPAVTSCTSFKCITLKWWTFSFEISCDKLMSYSFWSPQAQIYLVVSTKVTFYVPCMKGPCLAPLFFLHIFIEGNQRPSPS